MSWTTWSSIPLSDSSRAKGPSGINRSICAVALSDRVVPLAMEVGAADVDCVHVLVGNGDAFGIKVGIELAADGQASVGCGGADQIDDDAVADQRLSTPVHGDEREQAVLDLVPLAGAGRQMVDGDLDAELVGQCLQLALPQPHT